MKAVLLEREKRFLEAWRCFNDGRISMGVVGIFHSQLEILVKSSSGPWVEDSFHYSYMQTVGTPQDFGYLGRLHDQQAALGSRDQVKGVTKVMALRGGGSCAENGIYRTSHRKTPRTLVCAICGHFHTQGPQNERQEGP